MLLPLTRSALILGFLTVIGVQNPAISGLLPVQQITAGHNFSCVLGSGKVKCGGKVIKGLNHPTQISQTFYNACAITADGVKCWYPTGEFFAAPDSTRGATQLSSSYAHTCALVSDQVICWSAPNEPLKLKEVERQGLKNPKILATGWDHHCAISDLGLECWGSNDPAVNTVPESMKNAAFVAVSTGSSCAIANGKMECWGAADSAVVQNFPKDLKNVMHVSVGLVHACAIASGKVQCWGDAKSDRLDDQDPARKLEVPQDVRGAIRVAVGENHSCALTAFGARCWGGLYLGRLKTPAQLFGIFPKATQLAAGTMHSCAVLGSQVKCWGSNDYGQSSPPRDLRSPLQIASGMHSSCALTADKKVKCWGEINGVPSDLKNPSLISVGWIACAATDDGVRCWQKSKTNAGIEPYALDSRIAGMTQVTSLDSSYRICAVASGKVLCEGIETPNEIRSATLVSAGIFHACSVTETAEVQCWPITRVSGSPVRSAFTLNNASQISSGPGYTCALAQGKVSCKGNNVPVVPKDLKAVTQVSAGGGHACAISGGKIRCWGASEEDLSI